MTKFELFQSPGSSDESVELQVPEDFDYTEAYQRWTQCGGQVRTFYGGETGVDTDTLSFTDWVLSQEGGQFPQNAS